MRTRRSTSGGVVVHGSHLIDHWSSTQSIVALSSAEAELNAIVKCTAEILGVMNLMKECGCEVTGKIFTDSSAARGIVQRQGAGRVKHLECRQLWVQEVMSRKDVVCLKIPREQNPADALTHHWTIEDGQRHLQDIGVERFSEN